LNSEFCACKALLYCLSHASRHGGKIMFPYGRWEGD
jgi:hypothetical protein